MKNPRKVLVLFAYASIILCVVFALRYFYIQVIRGEHFQSKVAEQRVKEIVELPERGKILDRNGNVMALSLMAQDINVYPNLIVSKEQQENVAKLLSDTLDIKYDKILKIVEGDSYWSPIAKRVDFKKVQKIREAKLGGIEIKQSPKRFYPNGNVGGSVLGFVNGVSDPMAGIELSMNQYLAGVPGYTIAETDNVGKVIPVGFENKQTPLNGQQVSLTVDNYMQYVLDKRLEQAQKEMNPVSIHAILMNPKNGEIYAMSSTPTFDPNNYSKSKQDTWTNTPSSYVYEPGSTFKPVFMANALELGAINENSTWYDGAGSINVGGSNIKNWDGRALGEMSLKDIIINSSNVGMIRISQEMTSKQIVDGLKSHGFAQRTGVELPGEETGLFPTTGQLDNDIAMKATVSFGQGIAITPVQLVTAFSEIINGGKEIRPTLVHKVEDENGNILLDNSKEEQKRAYRPEVSKAMKSYLRANSDIGSGKDYQVDGYHSGSKTGSAWVVENGRYKKGVIVGSFLGFAPYENPEFALLVVVNQPNGIEFGGPSAGPIWHDVMEEVLRYKGVKKEVADKEEEDKTIEIPDVRWMLYDEAKVLIEEKVKNVKVTKIGKGSVVYEQDYDYKKGKMSVKLKTKPLKEKDNMYVPDLKGKTKEEVKEALKPYGVKMKFHGDGEVVEQNVIHGKNNIKKELIFWLD